MKKEKEPTLKSVDQKLDRVVQILDGVTQTLKEQGMTLKEHSEILKVHGEILESHSETLKSHGEILKSNGELLKGVTVTLKEHSETLASHDELFAFIIEHMATKEDLAIEIGKSESRMMDTMDRMVVDFRGDLVAMTRKVDHKDSGLVRMLSKKQVVTKPEAEKLLAMSPFPHPAR